MFSVVRSEKKNENNAQMTCWDLQIFSVSDTFPDVFFYLTENYGPYDLYSRKMSHLLMEGWLPISCSSSSSSMQS